MTEEYYPYPWQIHWTQWQIQWILNSINWNCIKENKWPFSIQPDVMLHAGFSRRAAFELISLIYAEMQERLESVGKDGDICMCRFYNEYTTERICKIFDLPYRDVKRRIKRAMRYMCGRRKKVDYSEWIFNGWSEKPRQRKSQDFRKEYAGV